MYLMLAATIAVTANFYEPDPSLEGFSLAVQEETEEPDEASLTWRLLGWGEYLACGSVPISVAYRKDRSSWDPTLDNAALNAGAWIGTAQGMNMISEFMRVRGATKSAWMLRVGTIASCAFSAGMNFNRGFFRE
jgi:hypothetical protein